MNSIEFHQQKERVEKYEELNKELAILEKALDALVSVTDSYMYIQYASIHINLNGTGITEPIFTQTIRALIEDRQHKIQQEQTTI